MEIPAEKRIDTASSRASSVKNSINQPYGFSRQNEKYKKQDYKQQADYDCHYGIKRYMQSVDQQF